MSLFTQTDHFFIDERLNLIRFANHYRLYDGEGKEIGAIRQKLSTGAKILRLLVNKAMLPFELHIENAEGRAEAVIKRGWTFWMSKISIENGEGREIGSIKQKFRLLKPRFVIADVQEKVIAEINGDWKAWDFVITNEQNQAIGAISKKWGGVARELFTSADKYHVALHPGLHDEKQRTIILAAAITIDMVLKESK